MRDAATASRCIVLLVLRNKYATLLKKSRTFGVMLHQPPLVGWYHLTGGTIKNVSLRLKEIKKRMEEEGIFGVFFLRKKLHFLTSSNSVFEKFLGGIEDMPRVDVYVVDPRKEQIAVKAQNPSCSDG